MLLSFTTELFAASCLLDAIGLIHITESAWIGIVLDRIAVEGWEREEHTNCRGIKQESIAPVREMKGKGNVIHVSVCAPRSLADLLDTLIMAQGLPFCPEFGNGVVCTKRVGKSVEYV